MINNALQCGPYRAELARETRTQILDFLQPDAVDALFQCLCRDVPWQLAEHDNGESTTLAASVYGALSVSERAQRLQLAYDKARHGFQFAYESYPMIEAAKQGKDPNLLLHVVLEFLNSLEFLQFARWLTADPSIERVSAQATRYRSGHFLTAHDDQVASEGRQFAYVINLTRRWQADWGGMLHFLAHDGEIAASYLPRHNSLSLFRVPQMHVVSLVTPWAMEDRYAITGWFSRASS